MLDDVADGLQLGIRHVAVGRGDHDHGVDQGGLVIDHRSSFLVGAGRDLPPKA